MPLISKPNYNQIFASQAPDQDKPAVFNNYPLGWGPESRPNNGKPTIRGFNYLQQTSDLKDLWILQNGACLPYDESIEYTEGAPVLKDGVIQYKTAGGFKSRDSVTVPTYNNAADGVDPVTGVADGAYFNVRSTDDDAMLVEYQNVGGSAVATGKSYLSALGAQQQEKPASTIKDASGKDQQEINNFYLTPYQFGAVGDGVYHALSEYYSTLAEAQTIYPFATSLTDSIDWAALQKQANHAIAYGYGTLNIPDGNFVINKTLNLGNLSVVGNGFGSRITPVINDGSVAVNVVPGSNFFKLKDFRIWSDGARLNCIGMSIGKSDSDLNAANRYELSGIHVHGLKQGVDMCGWIGDVSVFIDYCDLGFVGKSLNAGRYLIHTEQCTEAGRIDGVQGSTLQLMAEGSVTTIQKGFLIDAVFGGTLIAPYFEAVGTTGGILEYFCKIGTIKPCVGVTVNSGSTFGFEVSDSYWVFDNIDGLSVDEHWIQGSQTYSKGRLYRTTGNTKRIRKLNFITPQNLSFWIKDNSKALRPYQNLFANGNFLAGIKGFRRIDALIGSTVTKVTDITRLNGASAIKVQSGAGVLGSNGSFTFPNVINKNFKGKKVFLGVWLYVPDIAEYNDFSLKSPNVSLTDGVTSSLSGLTLFSKDQWHFVIVQHTLSASATELSMKITPVGYRGASIVASDITGNEYVVCGGVYLLDNTSEVDAARVANGFVSDSGYSGRIAGNNFEMVSDDLLGMNTAAGWSAGDKVVIQNSALIQEYTCLTPTPTFRASKFVTATYTTATLPALTTSDVGVRVYDLTSATFKTWSGAAWV